MNGLTRGAHPLGLEHVIRQLDGWSGRVGLEPPEQDEAFRQRAEAFATILNGPNAELALETLADSTVRMPPDVRDPIAFAEWRGSLKLFLLILHYVRSGRTQLTENTHVGSIDRNPGTSPGSAEPGPGLASGGIFAVGGGD